MVSNSCDASTYYSSLSSDDLDGTNTGGALQATLQALLESTHTNVVPYTSTATDCWNALEVLDKDPASETDVILIYKLTPEPFSAQGVPSGWNREHVWPKSYGVGHDGPDTSDLHSLRAADWSVNSCRSNRYYAGGDLARSIFYMAARYDGGETDTADLSITDCPCLSTNTMGLLSDLLQVRSEWV
ncbi:hypothetical protein TeGR_g3700 [Tetraparma gracilis]|uniref:Uncharacterized protein n=1 Tax=Tetraparma gracilis TaxID=2962635 RepID=A0ABQ6MES0_9STRA|nr:hypothetical protein TeGR_g3700 [Tetraparma gracilis]